MAPLPAARSALLSHTVPANFTEVDIAALLSQLEREAVGKLLGQE
jgi:hypothetical protein